MSGRVLKWLLDEIRGPFVTSLNVGWFKLVPGIFTKSKQSTSATGSITLYWGGLDGKNTTMPYEDTQECISGRVRADLPQVQTTIEKKMSESKQFQAISSKDSISSNANSNETTRKKRKAAELAVGAEVVENRDIVEEEFGDAVEPAGTEIGFNASNQYLNLEYYTGLGESKRLRPMYLLTNFVQEWKREVAGRDDVVAPVYRVFESGWDMIDKVNRSMKYQFMLYDNRTSKRATEHQVRFDFVFTACLQSSFAIYRRVHEPTIDWETFGRKAAVVLNDVSRVLAYMNKGTV